MHHHMIKTWLLDEMFRCDRMHLTIEGIQGEWGAGDSIAAEEELPPPPGLLADPQASPETSAERADMLARVRRIIEEELTDRQRQALILLGVQDMPMEDAARKLKTNRNALYKLLHDARLRLKRRLSMEDITPNEVLTLFEQK